MALWIIGEIWLRNQYFDICKQVKLISLGKKVSSMQNYLVFLFPDDQKCQAYYEDPWIYGEGSGEGESSPKDDQLIVDQGSDPSEQGSGSGEGSGDGGDSFSAFLQQ